MVEYTYISDIEYDETLTAASVFPEWIHTDVVHLERLDEETLSPTTLRRAREANPEFNRYFTTTRKDEPTYDSVLDWYEYADELWEGRTDAFYAMSQPDTEEFVGMAFLENVDLSLERAKLGIWLDKDHRGQGLAQARAEALLVVAFDHLGLDVVEIEVVPENTASVKAVEKYMTEFGGSFDGRLRNATHTPYDGVCDLYKWSVSAEEFSDGSAAYTDTQSVE